jgi:secreted Zn-dependent insulinase-like peptidase
MGNLTAGEASACHRSILERLSTAGVASLPPSLRFTSARGRLPEGKQLEIHKQVGSAEESNSAAQVVLQAGTLDVQQQAALRVLASLMKQPCFDELRTKQQIGYVVHASHDVDPVHVDAGAKPIRVESLIVEVTSKNLSAPEVVRRIDAFLAEFRSSVLAALGEKTVGDHASALATSLTEPPRRLAIETARVWHHIRDQRREFAAPQRLADAIGRVAPAEVIAMHDAIVRTRISSLVYGNAHPLASPTDGASPLAPALPTGTLVDSADHAQLMRWGRGDAPEARAWAKKVRLVIAAAAVAAVVAVRVRALRGGAR